MRVLVFGAGGQVGQALLALSGADLSVEPVIRQQADLTDPASCAAVIGSAQVDAVINAAAWTAVDAAEDAEAEATCVNAQAPVAMARACIAKGLPFVHISSDYVLPGAGDAPQDETTPLGPLSAYGRGKAQAETDLAALCDPVNHPYAILRTSWVFSATGGNFVRTMLRLAQTRDALSVVGDQIGGPTPADAIAAACVDLARALCAGDDLRGVYNFSGAPDVSWADFARAIFEIAEAKVEVTTIPTTDYPTPAPRPANSRMTCDRIASDLGVERPDWRASLTQIIPQMLKTDLT